jgi:RNA polymerase sigma-70 factor, ECF subfamily
MARLAMGETTTLLEPGIGTRPDSLQKVSGERSPGVYGAVLAPVATPPTSAAREEPCAFEAFFQAEYPSLLRAMFLVTGNRYEAEEIVQDAFVRACERWEMVLRAENRAGYVYRMALNGYRSKLRRLARATRKTLRPQEEPDHFAAVDDRDALGRALAVLSKGQREALVLVEWMGMTDDEVGVLLGISPITVRVRIHRARAILRPLLERGAG